MTDMPNLAGTALVSNELAAPSPRHDVEETYWGYIIKSSVRPHVGMILLQASSLVFGASFLAAAVGLLVLPNVLLGSSDFTFRAVAAILFAAVAVFLLWFSSRGTESEIQIDTNLGEVREAIRNRAGKTTLLGRYGFDSIGGVFIDRQDRKKGNVALVLRYQNTAQTLLVATGREDMLEPLRDRLGRDLMLGGAARSEPAIPQRLAKPA